MNFSEFRKLLGADPRNREPETLRARNSGPEFEQAAKEAEAFERKLQQAVEVAVDETLLADLLEIPGQPVGRRLPAWVAMAASVVIVAGVAGILWLQSVRPDTIEEYVAQHFGHDGASLFERATGDFDKAQIARVLASFGVTAGDELQDRISFIKYCPTMDGRGAHMVVATDQGPVQLIYMPNTSVNDRQSFGFEQMQAHLVDLDHGSVAIIGGREQPVAALDNLARTGFRPTTADA